MCTNDKTEEPMDQPSGAKLIDGKGIAAGIRSELREEISTMTVTPGLAVILVGSRRDSQTYVKMKKKACQECGVHSVGYDLPETVSEKELLQLVEKLNNDDKIHGILVQLPLPSHIDEQTVLDTIDPNKDVDGLHPLNVAQLCATSTHGETLDWTRLEKIPFPIACTPQGCIELLVRSKVELKGKRACVVGRSNLVGLPVALLLQHLDATVTIVHSKTNDPASICRQADVVVAAVGRPGIITSDWIQEGAVVIDVGINSVPADNKRGYRLVGDVEFDSVQEVASQITPVPGGVGPMTIAMLLRNTVNACKRSQM